MRRTSATAMPHDVQHVEPVKERMYESSWGYGFVKFV